jgi:hypothetical protein
VASFTSRTILPPGKEPPVPLDVRLRGPQSLSGCFEVENSLPCLESNQIIRPLAGAYNDNYSSSSLVFYCCSHFVGSPEERAVIVENSQEELQQYVL